MTDTATALQQKLAAENDASLANAGRVFAWLFFLAGVGLLVWSFLIGLREPTRVEHDMLLGGALDPEAMVHAIMVCLTGIGFMITGAVLLVGGRRA
jgi:hypothetical protein